MSLATERPEPLDTTRPARRARRTWWVLPVALTATLAVLTSACGGGSDDSSEGAQTPSSLVADTDEGDVVASIDDAQRATVQIVANGSLRDPEVGLASNAGSGSGFVISADGLAVTNNHVVTGAATLEVYLGGDTSKSYNAKVVGVSECNDLAVIDIDAPGELPRFDWYDGEIKAGLDVYAAGFPLGDPEFTLTRGIVAKARAGGDLTGTSSIDHTIEHDANIQPGNSGGPLLTPDGKVVGVNYAGGASATTTAQFYAIASDLAKGVVDRLRTGDFESLGINGWAVFDDAAGIAGIWAAGVAPGSAAARAGVLPGDIVTSMNGLPVGTDGTFKDYCDVLRTAADRPIAVEVLRWDTEEVLRGELNGDQPLVQAFSFAEEIEEEVPAEAASYDDYVSITDDTGVLTVEVPAAWSSVDTSPADDGAGTMFPYIAAAPDLDAFLGGWDTPGMQFGALPADYGTIDEILASFGMAQACDDAGILDYDDGAFVGRYQVWERCGGTDTVYVVLATHSTVDQEHAYLTVVQAVSSADLEVLDHVLATFNING